MVHKVGNTNHIIKGGMDMEIGTGYIGLGMSISMLFLLCICTYSLLLVFIIGDS
jgi:hypothetical protein